MAFWRNSCKWSWIRLHAAISLTLSMHCWIEGRTASTTLAKQRNRVRDRCPERLLQSIGEVPQVLEVLQMRCRQLRLESLELVASLFILLVLPVLEVVLAFLRRHVICTLGIWLARDEDEQFLSQFDGTSIFPFGDAHSPGRRLDRDRAVVPTDNEHDPIRLLDPALAYSYGKFTIAALDFPFHGYLDKLDLSFGVSSDSFDKLGRFVAILHQVSTRATDHDPDLRDVGHVAIICTIRQSVQQSSWQYQMRSREIRPRSSPGLQAVAASA